MHDIRAIRENPEAFDEGLRRRGLGPRAESLIALDEKRRRGDRGASARAGAPQRRLEADRRGDGAQGYGRGRGFPRRGRRG